MSVELLHSQGYYEVETGITHSELAVVMAGFKSFRSLSDEMKQSTNYFLSDRGDGDFGYFNRIPGAETFRGKASDNKDIFHFGASTRQTVEATLPHGAPKVMADFLDDAESLFWQAQATKKRALGKLNLVGLVDVATGSFSDYSSVFLSTRSACNDVLRLINYYDSDSLLAKAHFDRSATTLALGESHPGLRLTASSTKSPVEERNQTLQPVAYTPGQAKFFLGAGWNNIQHLDAKAKTLPLGWHDVVQTETVVDDYVRRWSAILFSTPHLEWSGYSVPGRNVTRPTV